MIAGAASRVYILALEMSIDATIDVIRKAMRKKIRGIVIFSFFSEFYFFSHAIAARARLCNRDYARR